MLFTQILSNLLSPLLAPVAFPGPAVLLTALSLNLGATPVRAVTDPVMWWRYPGAGAAHAVE